MAYGPNDNINAAGSRNCVGMTNAEMRAMFARQQREAAEVAAETAAPAPVVPAPKVTDEQVARCFLEPGSGAAAHKLHRDNPSRYAAVRAAAVARGILAR